MLPSAGTDSGSIRFDRAAKFYDPTRRLLPEAERATVQPLRAELAGPSRCLEVGVGTGLISLPLHRAGVPMVRLDLSSPMLAKLVEKAGGVMPFPLVLADATGCRFVTTPSAPASSGGCSTSSPSGDDSSRSSFGSSAPAELLSSASAGSRTRGVVDRFLDLAGGVPFAVGLDPRDPAPLDREFERFGAVGRLLPPIATHDDTTVGRFHDEMDAGMQSWTWRVPADVRRRVLPELRTWAKRRFGSLERSVEPDLQLLWRAFDLP